jgi:preprotein translocase subunit SecD
VEEDTQLPNAGYIQKTESADFLNDFSTDKYKLIRSTYTVDNESKYNAIVVVKNNPAITNSDIQKTRTKGNMVEIHFNIEGARKWAEMTKNNIGKMVAFVIENKVYSLPKINAEIRTGIAIISGFESEEKAGEISESL